MKNFFCILLMFIGFHQMNAQLGIKGGLNLAKFAFSEGDNGLSILKSAQIGIFCDGKITPRITLRSGINYNQKGYSVLQGGSFKLNIVEFSEDLQITVYKFDEFSCRTSAGATIGYAHKGTRQFLGNKTEVDFDQEFLNRIDYGINLGVEFDFNEPIVFGINYHFGLSDISSDPNAGDWNYQHRVISALCGIRF